MPQQLTDAARDKIIRAIENASHLLRALPREPELNDSIEEQIRELEDAERELGFEPSSGYTPSGGPTS